MEDTWRVLPAEEAQGRNAGLVHDFDDEDPDLAAALAASMADTSGQASTSTAQQEEADMAAARLATLDPGQEPAVGPSELAMPSSSLLTNFELRHFAL